MARSGAARLDGFVRPEAVARLAADASELVPLGFGNDDVHTVYSEDVDASLPTDDPRRMLVRSAQKAVAMDLLPENFGVRRLYAWDDLTNFVAAALGKDRLYRSEDPLDGCNVTVYEEGDELGWHFDRSEFSITLMIQPAEQGGVFEYVPAVRSADDERHAVVGAILAGEQKDVIELPSVAGTARLLPWSLLAAPGNTRQRHTPTAELGAHVRIRAWPSTQPTHCKAVLRPRPRLLVVRGQPGSNGAPRRRR